MKYKEVEIKSVYKYIGFVKDEVNSDPNKKTIIIDIISISSGMIMGTISWYSPWRQYVWNTMHGYVFNSQCARDVVEFLENLNKAHRGTQYV